MASEPATGAPSPRQRLSADDWIEAAIDALLAEGGAGLRIAKLARRLGVTPGSFYWHFRDRDELRDRVLQHWRDRLLRPAAAASLEAGKGPEALRRLPGILVQRRLPHLDAAFRRWGREDPVVAAAVANADELRVRVVTGLLEKAGVAPEAARIRARLFFWVFLGSGGATDEERQAGFAELIEALLHDVS